MWFFVLTIVVLNIVFLFMPKKLTPIEIFSTCMFAMVFQQIVDLALDLKLDWYGYFTKGIQWTYNTWHLSCSEYNISELLSIHEEYITEVLVSFGAQYLLCFMSGWRNCLDISIKTNGNCGYLRWFIRSYILSLCLF